MVSLAAQTSVVPHRDSTRTAVRYLAHLIPLKRLESPSNGRHNSVTEGYPNGGLLSVSLIQSPFQLSFTAP